jgi:hypothetical protein
MPRTTAYWESQRSCARRNERSPSERGSKAPSRERLIDDLRACPHQHTVRGMDAALLTRLRAGRTIYSPVNGEARAGCSARAIAPNLCEIDQLDVRIAEPVLFTRAARYRRVQPELPRPPQGNPLPG